MRGCALGITSGMCNDKAGRLRFFLVVRTAETGCKITVIVCMGRRRLPSMSASDIGPGTGSEKSQIRGGRFGSDVCPSRC